MKLRYKLLLLDRDGVLNQKMKDGEYVIDKSKLFIVYGVLERVAKLTHQVRIAVVTNQQGVGKGLMSHEDLDNVNNEFNKHIVRLGGQKIRFFTCTHLRDADCGCRKPKPGLLLEAISSFGVLPRETVFIGDQETDREAAKSAGIDFLKTCNPQTTISHLESLSQGEKKEA